MSNLRIAANNRNFELNNEYFFYLADTCWSAFTNISIEDWKYYLQRRKMQGFNALQINILPQWDRSVKANEELPFGLDSNSIFDYSKVNMTYFDHARKMCIIAKEYGFQLGLVVLWANYVPNTWASALNGKNIMPKEFLDTYFDIVLEKFNDLNPIYIIAGDTDLDNKESIEYYNRGLEYFCSKSPSTLKTLHIRGRYETIPDELVKNIDFYMYQSGHNSNHLNMPYYLADVFFKKNPIKPILNSEPCYEQMGYSRGIYGRFDRFDVRKAGWQSVLAGGCSGLTYGAHGIWSWQEICSKFMEGMGEAFDSPLLWHDALHLNGAYDYGMLKYLLEDNELFNIIPRNDLLINDTEEIRLGLNEDETRIALYIPQNTNVRVNTNLSKFKFYLFDLEMGKVLVPNVDVENDVTIFRMHDCVKDVIIIGRQK